LKLGLHFFNIPSDLDEIRAERGRFVVGARRFREFRRDNRPLGANEPHFAARRNDASRMLVKAGNGIVETCHRLLLQDQSAMRGFQIGVFA